MRFVSAPPVPHVCDISSIETLADAIGLTIGEIETALYGRSSVRRRCCSRMLAACVDGDVLDRCDGRMCRILSRHLSAA